MIFARMNAITGQVQNEIDKIKRFCTDNGYVFTPQRKIVLQQLLLNKEFIEAEDLWLQILNANLRISLPSVYTVMRWLIRSGFAEQQSSRGRKQGYRYKFN